jgi:hypothetical protein
MKRCCIMISHDESDSVQTKLTDYVSLWEDIDN